MELLNFQNYFISEFEHVGKLMEDVQFEEGFPLPRATETPWTDALCMICRKIPRRMEHHFGCRHKFCNYCLGRVSGIGNHWEARNCPVCGESYWASYNPISRNRNDKILDRWKAISIACQQGCGVKSSPGTADDHEIYKCPSRPLLCPNLGCEAVVKFANLEKHYRECLFTSVLCDKCKVYYPKFEAAEHDCVRALKRAIDACKAAIEEWDRHTRNHFPNLVEDREFQRNIALRFDAPQNEDEEYVSDSEPSCSSDEDSECGHASSLECAKEVKENMSDEDELLSDTEKPPPPPPSPPVPTEPELLTGAFATMDLDVKSANEIVAAALAGPGICDTCGMTKRKANHNCIAALRFEWEVQFTLMPLAMWKVPIYATPQRHFRLKYNWQPERFMDQAILNYNYQLKLEKWSNAHKSDWKELVAKEGIILD